jgi:D-serine deaminase-like pyridoxal phosphate-dependent protein
MDTPALIVDLDKLEANIDEMQAEMRDRGVALRPHAKTHKCIELARLQVAAGARGLTVATLGEAEVFAREGFDDLFVAYPLWVGDDRSGRLAQLAGEVALRVGVESVPSAQALAEAVAGLEVMIEIDSGQHRTGTTPELAVALADVCVELGLAVRGVFSHGGHAYRGPADVVQAATDETNALSAAAEMLRDAGHGVDVVSAGSTPTAIRSAGGAVNEERPGSYVFYDRQQVVLGSCAPERVALHVAATVVSKTPGRCVIDAGSKALGSDRPSWLEGFGELDGFENSVVTSLSEHHGIVSCERPPNIGSVVSVVPNHVCTVVNLFDNLVVTRGGEVVDEWPVAARGR